ncbi:MAG: transposase [Acidobacteriia bacterium]|nr:transposase [Terriglobia bacterium]
MGTKRPPRIKGISYVGASAYFLTICAVNRSRPFVEPGCASAVCEQFLRTASAYRFAVDAYCLMPDHFHALVEGLADNSDFRRFVAMFKQRTSFEHRRATGLILWQEGYFERVLRTEEPRLAVAAYIVNNPIRAGLCKSIEQYPFTGSNRYTLNELAEAVQFRPDR